MHFSFCFLSFFFFFNGTATTEIYTLSLHDALPTSPGGDGPTSPAPSPVAGPTPTEPGLADARIRLVPVAELEQPVAMAVRAGDHALYVAEKVGRVVALS